MIWTNNQFTGHWPVGTAAVVCAETAEDAAKLLNAELVSIGLGPTATPDEMRMFDQYSLGVRILRDGDY